MENEIQKCKFAIICIGVAVILQNFDIKETKKQIGEIYQNQNIMSKWLRILENKLCDII
jgi:hypothetical protein